MDTLNPGVSTDAAGEAVEAATPELEQTNESQQIETTEVDQTEAKSEPTTDGQDDQGKGEGDDPAPETKSQRQRRLKRERQAERDRKLAEARKRLKEIDEAEAALKDPSLDDVDDPDKRVAIMASNEARRYHLQDDKRRLDGEIQAAEAEARREWTEKAERAEADARTRYADYDAKVEALTRVTNGRVNPAITDALQQSDNPADLAYYLGNNPEEAARINSLSDLSAAREIGRIEAGLQIPKPKTKTNAPPPIKPINSGASEVVKNPDDMSFAEYEAARKAGKL